MFLSSGDHEQAAQARIEWLVFAFRETETFGSGGYFGPRYSRSDGTPFPDFYSLPPNTREYLQSRLASTPNPIHRARYGDFLWDKFRDAEAGAAALPAYIECARLFTSRGDGNAAFRAVRRACHLARQLGQPELRDKAKDAAMEIVASMSSASTIPYVPRVAEALMGLAEHLSPEQRRKLSELLEQARAAFAKSHEHHLERGALKVLRQLYRLMGDEEAARKAWFEEGESYETEGDYKFRLDGSGGGPEVAAHLYQLALTHFLDMGDPAKVEAIKKKMNEAHRRGPVNFQAFIEALRRGFTGQTGGGK